MIAIKCKMCGKELAEPGALVFSPPMHDNIYLAMNEDDMKCKKYHICVNCYDKLYDFIDYFENK